MPWLSCTTGIADLQFGQVAQPAFEVGAAGIGAPPARTRRGGVELVFGDDGDAIQHEAARQGADAEHEARLAARKPAKSALGRGRPYSAR
jgi:hypothetical protein